MTNYLNTCKSINSLNDFGIPAVTHRPFSWSQPVEAIVAMYRRSKQRQDLKNLDARLLKDVGLTFEQAQHEASKPFWKA